MKDYKNIITRKKFDNFGDIEANNEANYLLTTIKKNNIEIEQKEFLKQNKKYKDQKTKFFHEFSDIFYKEIYDFLNNDKGERYPKKLEEEIDKSDMNRKKTLDAKNMAFQRS